MSWLGSLTEKITDFTKEVLIDDSATDKIDAANQNGISSYEELLNLCKDKDQKISNLISEKEYLENCIEELDQQHQEALDALLTQKSQATAENNELKEKVAAEKQKFDHQRTDFHSIYGSSDTSSDIKLNASENQYTELIGENINLISILQSVSDCSEDEKFKKQIAWLEKHKEVLSTDTSNSSDNINKIDNYINFLEALHSQSLYSVVDEICSIFNTLVSDNNQLKQNSNSTSAVESFGKPKFHTAVENKICSCQCNNHNLNESNFNIKTSETFSQTDDFQIVSSDIATQTLFSDEYRSSPVNIIKSNVSKHSQTDCDNQEKECKVLKDDLLLHKLKSNILLLEEDKLHFQQETEILQSLLNKKTSTEITQTDDDTFKKLELELSSAQNIISNQVQAYNVLENKLSQQLRDLTEELQSRTSIITTQESEILLLQGKICSLEEMINNLKQNIKELQENKISNDKEEMSITRNSALQQGTLDKNSSSADEIIILQKKLKTSELEKGKLLCVLNEKTQECSNLKTEVHKLTNIVASEKQALFKLQRDNCNLKQSNEEKSDPELTKEAIKKLSSLIRDKDLEIDSLKQKNTTLTTLIQNVTSVPEHLQSLMDEKENLSKQIHDYKTERDKIMLSYNTKDKEWRESSAELKKLNNLLTKQRKEFDVLEQTHCSISQQYEEKQKSLINAQSEIITLKQRINELEQQLVDVKQKHSDLLNAINSDLTIQITKEELHEKNDKIERLTCGNEEKDHLIQEKDCMIHDLSQQVKKLKLESEQQSHATQELQEKISTFTDKIKEADVTVEQSKKEKGSLEQRFQDKSSELDLLKEMNERLNMTVKEKEFAIQSMTEKISSLSQYISDESFSSRTADVNQILAESESMFSEAQKFRRERDETLLALSQSKQENQSLRNEIQRMKSTEIHLENQLSRLRQHLLEVEENYTNEALKAEEREKVLKDELVEVKRRADITSTAVVDTSQRASIQIASLQEQLSIVANQRDEALSQVSSLEDKVLQHSTSVNKLQLVLEQIQKGNERKLKEVDIKWQSQLGKQKETINHLEKHLQVKQMQLDESSKALEAASRLSEQLDAKEAVIANLKSELSKTENKIRSTALEINSMKSNTEGKVDRVIMKSLVLGYFSTPPGQKSEVIRLLARVLDFNQEEMEKAGIVVGRPVRRPENKGIFSSIFNRLPSLGSPEHSPHQPQKSFTTLFVQFLENESQPIIPMPFPAEQMAQELTSKNHPNKKSLSLLDNSSPRRSPLLLDIDSAFPTFTPLPAVEYSTSPAPAILKEVLE